jgi:hypothetical protein
MVVVDIESMIEFSCLDDLKAKMQEFVSGASITHVLIQFIDRGDHRGPFLGGSAAEVSGAVVEALVAVRAALPIDVVLLIVFNGCRLYRLAEQTGVAVRCTCWAATSPGGQTRGFALNTGAIGAVKGLEDYEEVRAATNCTRALEVVAIKVGPEASRGDCADIFATVRTSDGQPSTFPDTGAASGFGGCFGPRPLPVESQFRELIRNPDWSSEPTDDDLKATAFLAALERNADPEEEEEGPEFERVRGEEEDIGEWQDADDSAVEKEWEKLRKFCVDSGSGVPLCGSSLPNGSSRSCFVARRAKVKAFMRTWRAKTSSRVPFAKLSISYRLAAEFFAGDDGLDARLAFAFP